MQQDRAERQRSQQAQSANAFLVITGIIAIAILGSCIFGVVYVALFSKNPPDQIQETPTSKAMSTTPTSNDVDESEPRPKVQPELKLGKIVFIASQKPLPGVVAFVEIDRANVADWPSAATKLEIPVLAGKHLVIFRSKYMGKYFMKEFGTVEIAEGKDKTLRIEIMDPDPKASW